MIHEALCDVVGTRHVVEGENGTIRVAPATTDEVADVVRICARHARAIIPEGGGTGLVGGCDAVAGQVVLSLSRMAEVEQIDPVERIAIVQAGAALETLQDLARLHGLEPGIDLAARGTATVGGMVSTNAGGVMAFRFGVMRHRVLGIEAVLPDGTIMSDMTRVIKNSAGYDLKHLLIGAEGTLGIVTRIVLRLEPLPQATATVLLGLPCVAAAFDAITLGLASPSSHLRAAEGLWQRYAQLTARMQGWDDRAFPLDQPLFLLLMMGGAMSADVQSDIETLFSALSDLHPTTTGVIASSDRQAQALWALREDTEQLYRLHPGAASYDVSVPLSQIATYVERVVNGLALIDGGIRPYLFGHLADGNLHIVLDRPGTLSNAVAADVEGVLYSGLHDMGGSFSAEHGVGSKRIHALRDCTDPGKKTAMRLIKLALDPAQIMNPGKVLEYMPLSDSRN